MNETLIALCASYAAFARYIDGADIYLMPRSIIELESMLYAYIYFSLALLFNLIFTTVTDMRMTPYIIPYRNQSRRLNRVAIVEYVA